MSLATDTLQLVSHNVMSRLPLSSCISLSQAHPSLRVHLPSHLAASFLGLLARHTSPAGARAFHGLLRDTRAVISGSTALHFVLNDTHWAPGDLDIYAPFGTGQAIAQWLVEHEGYTVSADGERALRKFEKGEKIRLKGASRGEVDCCTPLESMEIKPRSYRHGLRHNHYTQTVGDSNPHIYRVYKLHRSNHNHSSNSSARGIDIIEASSASFLPPITQFHSTLVMNYISPDALVVLYPEYTLRREGILQFRRSHAAPFAALPGAPPSSNFDALYGPGHPTGQAIPNPNSELPEPQKETALSRWLAGRDYRAKYAARGFTLFEDTAAVRPARACGGACAVRVREAGDRWGMEVRFGSAVVIGAGDAGALGSDLERGGEVLVSGRVGDGREQYGNTDVETADHELAYTSCTSVAPSPAPTSTAVLGARRSKRAPLTRHPLPCPTWQLLVPPEQTTKEHPGRNGAGRRGKPVCTNQWCFENVAFWGRLGEVVA